MLKYLKIGQIVNTHGLKGELKVVGLTDNPDRYNDLDWVYVDKPTGMEKYTVQKVKVSNNNIILKFKEIDDINIAQTLKGMYIKVDRENAVKLPDDAYFICDLIGVSVYEEDGNLLGTLKDVLKTGSNDVYIVASESGEEILIPALKNVVKEISISNNKIVVRIPEGLRD